jgi:hypothetical protein
MAALARADEIWIDEGIFDTIALEQGAFSDDRARLAEGRAEDAPPPIGGRHAVSIMSCYNYPEKALDALREAVLAGPTPMRFPRLVFALDLGAAGARYTREFVKRAREEGWPEVTAAQARLDDDFGAKLDWNDLFLRGDRLTPEHIADYLWHGEVLIAPDAEEKAFLLWKRRKLASFPFTFRNRTYWAWFSKEKIAETMAEMAGLDEGESVKDLPREAIAALEFAAARKAGSIREIANCAFRALYKQRDEVTDETDYFFRIDFPTDRPSAKGGFKPSAVSSNTEFAKRLVAIGTGAYYTGDTTQLVKILSRQMVAIKDVEPIPFTGYSRDHRAWLLGDIAVREGKLVAVNDNGFFDFGLQSVKIGSRERLLTHINTDDQAFRTDWLADFWTAYREKGLVTLAFWTGALFAEQVRALQDSFPFLELIGLPGTGKTSLLMLCWKLLGRVGWEGIDPNKATAAGLSRELAKVAGIPFVFLETRRDNVLQLRTSGFDWDELLTAYNGRAVRVRGVASGGNETYAPQFRSAILIEQNVAVDASPAMLERLLHVDFDKSGWSDETKLAARRIDALPVADVSGFILRATRAEERWMATFVAAYAAHEKTLRAMPGIVNQRLEHNHAQLLAMLDALAIVLPIPAAQVDATRAFIHDMAIKRHRAVETEHPTVIEFWERVEAILADAIDPVSGRVDRRSACAINHSRNADKGEYAIQLTQYEQIASIRWRNQPNGADLRRLLKTSKDPAFVAAKTVNSADEKPRHCWVFQRQGVARAAA